jgi:hypothetical protein
VSGPLKPEVEGLGGKSRVIDVAVSAACGPPVTAVATSSAGATPNPVDVDPIVRKTKEADDSTAATPLNQATAGTCTVADAEQHDATTVPAADTAPSGQASGTIVTAAMPADQFRLQATRLTIAAERGPAVARAAVVSSRAAAATPAAPASASAKTHERFSPKRVVAGIYLGANVFGAAVLAFAAQLAIQRWRRSDPNQPRPVVLQRKKPQSATS